MAQRRGLRPYTLYTLYMRRTRIEFRRRRSDFAPSTRQGSRSTGRDRRLWLRGRTCALRISPALFGPFLMRGKSTTTADTLPTRAEGRALRCTAPVAFSVAREFLREMWEWRHE